MDGCVGGSDSVTKKKESESRGEARHAKSNCPARDSHVVHCGTL